MSGVIHTFKNLSEDVAGYFGLKGTLDKVAGAANLPGARPGPQPPVPPTPPTQDIAANAAQQQMDMLRRRRGILGNIFAGQTATPQTQSKSLLGQ